MSATVVGALIAPSAAYVAIAVLRKRNPQTMSERRGIHDEFDSLPTLNRTQTTNNPKMNCDRQTSRQVSLGYADCAQFLQIVGIVHLGGAGRVVRRLGM